MFVHPYLWLQFVYISFVFNSVQFRIRVGAALINILREEILMRRIVQNGTFCVVDNFGLLINIYVPGINDMTNPYIDLPSVGI